MSPIAAAHLLPGELLDIFEESLHVTAQSGLHLAAQSGQAAPVTQQVGQQHLHGLLVGLPTGLRHLRQLVACSHASVNTQPSSGWSP